MRKNIIAQSKSSRVAQVSMAFLLILAITLSLVPSASGAPRLETVKNSIPAGIDDEVKSRSVTINSQIVHSISVSIKFEKLSGPSFSYECLPLGGSGHDGSSPYNNEISFRLVSPLGTSVDLVFDKDTSATYTSLSEYGGVVTVVFDDKAATQVGGTKPTSGTFRPEKPLNNFIGENAGGNWTLHAGDNSTGDALCLYEWSLTIDSYSAPLGGFINPINRDLTRCKLTYIDSKIYIGSDNFFVARGLGKPETLRFTQDGVLAGFMTISSYGFEDAKWKIISNMQYASGMPMFEPGIYHVACFGPGGTAGTPLRTTISR